MPGWNQELRKRMYDSGCRYFVEPNSGSFDGLCVKGISDITYLLRKAYPNETFQIAGINEDGSLTPFKKATA